MSRPERRPKSTPIIPFLSTIAVMVNNILKMLYVHSSSIILSYINFLGSNIFRRNVTSQVNFFPSHLKTRYQICSHWYFPPRVLHLLNSYHTMQLQYIYHRHIYEPTPFYLKKIYIILIVFCYQLLFDSCLLLNYLCQYVY